MLVVLIMYLLICTANASAQEAYFSDINGVPLKEKKVNIVEGSIYLSDNWVKGSVKFKNGKSANDIELRFDQLNGLLVFRNDKNQEFTFVSDVAEFRIPYTLDGLQYPGVFRSGFPNVKGLRGNTFLEVLFDGRVKLLKQTVKSLLETKAFYSATTESTVVQESRYYIFKDGSLFPIKKDSADILKILKDQEQLNTYIKEKKPKLKDDQALIQLMTYYDSL